MGLCEICSTKKSSIKVPSTGLKSCKECFFEVFEERVHQTITKSKLFKTGDKVAIAVSGGKDSTVLAHVMTTLNRKHSYGLDLCLLSIDEGITGYRDDSLETVKRNKIEYQIPLKIISYQELYGWTMDRIVASVGKKSNCTFCGVFRRQALDRGALLLGGIVMNKTKIPKSLLVNHIVTGHNADDIAETVLMNIMRGDFSRLQRCTAIQTSTDDTIPRAKPFKYTYEKEIVMYAYFKKLDYFSTECIYSPNAYRGHARTFLKDLEAINPSAILDIIQSGESYQSNEQTKMYQPSSTGKISLGTCERCGYMSSNSLCKACVMLEGLNRGLPKLAVGSSQMQRTLLQEGKKEGSIQVEVMQNFKDLAVSKTLKGPSLEF